MRGPIKKIFTFDPLEKREGKQIHQVQNLIKGEWTTELKENEQSTIVLRFNHDGFIALPGDQITYYWNFIRYL